MDKSYKSRKEEYGRKYFYHRENIFMNILDKDLILLNLNAEKEEDVINVLGNLLYSRKYVKDTYIPAVLAREKIYPTGLKTPSVNVAIPHTDSTHVNRTSMAVGILKKPVIFNVMGSEGDSVAAEIIFLLAMRDPNQQVEMLKSIMQLLQDDKCLLNLKSAKTKDEVIKHLENFIS